MNWFHCIIVEFERGIVVGIISGIVVDIEVWDVLGIILGIFYSYNRYIVIVGIIVGIVFKF
jgi:hypothetical protein